jgi:16S rRNA (cytosine967-C5)-methyltransferase
MPARQVALRVLGDLREGRKTARQSIDALIARQTISSQDLSLATELVMGVVRHRLTLARVLGAMAARGWKNVNHVIQHILMLGAYQLIWLDHIPEFAAVHSAVEQAKGEGGIKASRFVNAILRRLLRDIEHRRIAFGEADPVRAIPVDLQTCCQMRTPIFADPKIKPVEYWADATSHPGWLVARWLSAFGLHEMQRICLAGMSRPPLVLRPNRLRVNATELMMRLQQEGIVAEATPSGAVVIARSIPITRIAAFTEGLFQPQDPTSMQVVREMGLAPGQAVLDLCAGLGTKTTQMAEAMQNRGSVLATDKDEPKLELLRSNCERLGHSIVQTVPMAKLQEIAEALPKLDWILVDAPCSNTGVFARRPEARYRLNERSIASLEQLQLQLLEQAAGLAHLQTRIMYSTCSIDPQENEQLITAFLEGHPGWLIKNSQLTLPSGGPTPAEWRDGGFWAILVRET